MLLDLRQCVLLLIFLLSFCHAFTLLPLQRRIPRHCHTFTLLMARKQTPKRRFSQAAHDTPRKLYPKKSPKQEQKKKKDELWQSSKSIDDLEATMTKRWGTALEKWTADPNEYEFVDDPDSTESSGVFRAKPVLDPWQTPEQQTEKEVEVETYSTDDVVLNRVRRNQERLQQRQQQQEFYDEDDEGYEPERHSSDDDNDISVDHLIAPRPVGGRGTRESMSPRDENESPGFFFNSNVAQENKKEDTEESEEQDSAPKKRRRQTSVPVTDDDGNPIFLTLEQAERDFKASLISQEEEGSQRPPAPKSWTELGITSETLLTNLEEMGCKTPLAVQDKACPSVITGNDVLVGTYTGSGKTLAFLVPLAQQILFSSKRSDGIQVLIVAPGRELASQIVSVARELLEGTDITAMLAIGGTTFARNLEQIRKRKPSILVGTPGRIAELVVGRPGEK